MKEIKRFSLNSTEKSAQVVFLNGHKKMVQVNQVSRPDTVYGEPMTILWVKADKGEEELVCYAQ